MPAELLSTNAARSSLSSCQTNSVANGPGLAHDAGNLLGALTLYSELLGLPGVLKPEHQHYARELKLLSQRSGALIYRLLKTTGADDGPAKRPRKSSAAMVVRSFSPVLRSLAAPEVTLTMTVLPLLPALPFAAEVLERILVNLTRNAATALHTHIARDSEGAMVGGEIQIGVSGDASRLSLIVNDNGPGMTPAWVADFMKPSPLPPGATCGLGHHVVRELVESTGGNLWITATPGRGTKLQIDWPISQIAKREAGTGKMKIGNDALKVINRNGLATRLTEELQGTEAGLSC